MEVKPRFVMRFGLALLLLVPVVALAWGSQFEPGVGETTLISLNSAGEQANRESGWPSISADGRYVAFESFARNLVDNDTNGFWDIFVRDTWTGQTLRVSVSSDGAQANGHSRFASISPDGRYVAFESEASNLVPGDRNGVKDVFVRDLQLGLTTRVSVSSSGGEGNGVSGRPSIASGGQVVAFESVASNLVYSDTNGMQDVFVRNLTTGETKRVSVSSAGVEGLGDSGEPAISADGRWVAFSSWAANLVPGDTRGFKDVFLHDLETGQTTRVSLNSAGEESNGSSKSPALSADGRHVAFASDATNLVMTDTNRCWDVFVHDRVTRQTMRVNISSAGGQADQDSGWPALSADGRYVAFVSRANNLVTPDSNGGRDVFLRDTVAGRTLCISVVPSGDTGNAFCSDQRPAISSGGRWVVFESWASDLVAYDANWVSDIFLRDLAPAPRPTSTPTLSPSMTPTVVCTPPACQPGEVLYCPGQCPGGCGYRCGTPTPTATPLPPRLISPPDGALLRQPVAPDGWVFEWEYRGPSVLGYYLYVRGPGGRLILIPIEGGAGTFSHTYTSTTYIPTEALSPWSWTVQVHTTGGSIAAAPRSFSVMPGPSPTATLLVRNVVRLPLIVR